MHRRTASALGQVPAPSRSIDFRAVSAPPGWGRVIPFVPRRRSIPVLVPTEKSEEPVQEILVAEPVPDDQVLAERIVHHRFLMGEAVDTVPPAPESRQEFVGIVQKPTPQNVIARARGRKREEIEKALKHGRKMLHGKLGAAGKSRPILPSSQQGVRQSGRSTKQKPSNGKTREPRPAKRLEPLPTLDDALYVAKAEHAWKRCNPPRILHHHEVLFAALVIQHGEGAFNSVVEYLVQCARDEVAQTQESGEQVTYGLLRRIIDRALGLLIQRVWNCVKYAKPYDSDATSQHRHRLRAWERRRSASVALRPFSIHVCRHPIFTDDKEVFFMLERADTGSPVIHALMTETEFGQRLRKLKPCCQPVRPTRLRVVDDEEEEEGLAS